MESMLDPLTTQILLEQYYPRNSFLIRPSSSTQSKTLMILKDSVLNIRIPSTLPESDILEKVRDVLGTDPIRISLLHRLPDYIHANHGNFYLRRSKPGSFLIRPPLNRTQSGLVLCVRTESDRIHKIRVLHCSGNGPCRGWSLDCREPTIPKFASVDLLVEHYRTRKVIAQNGEMMSSLGDHISRTWFSKQNIGQRIEHLELTAMRINAIDYSFCDLEFENLELASDRFAISDTIGLRNRVLNRQRLCVPYDFNIVRSEVYINASYIKYADESNRVIVAQAPTELTNQNFIEMIESENVSFMVCLADKKGDFFVSFPENRFPLTQTRTHNRILCEQYWKDPLFALKDEQFIEDDLIKRTLNEIEHYQLTSWPQHSVPTKLKSLRFLLDQTIEAITNNKIVLIHSSVGTGRSGVFVAILKLLMSSPMSDHQNVFEAVLELRRQKKGLIDNSVQYLFVHSFLRDMVY